MLHDTDELSEADLPLVMQPALGVGMRMPAKEQDGRDQTPPDLTLDPARVRAFGFIQAQDRLGLTKDQFDLQIQTASQSLEIQASPLHGENQQAH